NRSWNTSGTIRRSDLERQRNRKNWNTRAHRWRRKRPGGPDESGKRRGSALCDFQPTRQRCSVQRKSGLSRYVDSKQPGWPKAVRLQAPDVDDAVVEYGKYGWQRRV